MHINEIIPCDLLEEMIAEKYIKVTKSIDTLINVYNYTAKAQYENLWNTATLNCRGLITNQDGVILARPFKKFFNYTPDIIKLSLDEEVEVTEKLDGSLGILFNDGKNLRVSTRGNPDSEQSLHATKIFNQKYSSFKPDTGITYLFEIIYPENRIVVDYHGLDDLILIGAIDINSGISIPVSKLSTVWPGQITEVLPFKNVEEVLRSESRNNKEGYVIHFLKSDERFKLKHEEYLKLHLLISNFSPIKVWEILKNELDPKLIFENTPDEFYHELTNIVDDLNNKYNREKSILFDYFKKITSKKRLSKKEFAYEVSKCDDRNLRSLLFLLFDGRDYKNQLWERVKPSSPLY